MGPIVASYLVRIVLREREPDGGGAPPPEPTKPPTLETLENAIIIGSFRDVVGNLTATISSERVDR